eukprot:1138504-Pelagomonas_calceolata.AAC.3
MQTRKGGTMQSCQNSGFMYTNQGMCVYLERREEESRVWGQRDRCDGHLLLQRHLPPIRQSVVRRKQRWVRCCTAMMRIQSTAASLFRLHRLWPRQSAKAEDTYGTGGQSQSACTFNLQMQHALPCGGFPCCPSNHQQQHGK